MNKMTQKRYRYECLEFNCHYVVESGDEVELVENVQKHMQEEHDSFELEDIILSSTKTID